jgi:hypothetical protein
VPGIGGTVGASRVHADVVTHRVRLHDLSVDTADIAPGASSQPMPLGNVSKPYHCLLYPSMLAA